MKTGKEVKIQSFKNYNIIFGSVNNKQAKTVYINLSAWAEPRYDDDVNYSRVIKDLNKKIKQSIFNRFDNYDAMEFYRDRTIVDLDIRESGVRYGKRSFMNCEVTLFLTSETPVNSDSMTAELRGIVVDLIGRVFENNKIFKFHRKKK